MNNHDKAHWLADKICAYSSYANDAAEMLKQQADLILSMQKQINNQLYKTIYTIKLMKPQPGDLIVVSMNEVPDMDVLKQTMQTLREFFPPENEVKIMFCQADVSTIPVAKQARITIDEGRTL